MAECLVRWSWLATGVIKGAIAPLPVHDVSPFKLICIYHWVSSPLASYQIRIIVGCACAGNAGNVSPPPRASDPDMHHGTCVTYVLWCMPGWLTSGFLWNWWWGKRSRYSRRMRNPQFYLSDKRIISECSRSELAMMDGMWCYSSGTTPFSVSHGKSWSNGWHTSPISIIQF